MTDPTRGDLQAASGGRRKVALVPFLVSMTELPALMPFSGRHRKDPLAWAKGMVAGERTWEAIREMCEQQIANGQDDRWTLRVARIDLEAGTALGFNVNSGEIGSNL